MIIHVRTTYLTTLFAKSLFDNTENNEATKGTEDTELTLSREGDFVGSEDNVVEEINIFEGKFNRITFEQVFTKTFKCVYKLQLYPFDTQVCLVIWYGPNASLLLYRYVV